MTLYTYQAFTKQGKKTSGTIEAITIHEAKEKIRSMKLLLAKLEVQKRASKKQQFQKDTLLIFTSQLAQLLTSKIPLYESLVALEEQARNEPYHQVLLGLTERIKRGTSLSQAMTDFPDSFPPLYRALIQAGEAIGNLELSLNRLSSFLGHQAKIRKQLVSAMIYPALLLVLLILAITILVGFVIPSLESLFDDKEIPAFTQLVLSTSRFLREWGGTVITTIVALVSYTWYRLRRPKTKAKFQRKLLKVPLLARFIILSCLSRFAQTLSTLLDGGLPLVNSLTYAKEALNNARLEEVMERVETKIIEGVAFSHELSHYKEIPPLFSRMVAIGEESGKLSGMLSQLGTMYEEETERVLLRIVQLAQPVLLLLMGGLIGGTLLSILLPLSSFGSSLQL